MLRSRRSIRSRNWSRSFDDGAIADCTKAENLNSWPYRTRQRKSNKLCCIILRLLCGEMWYNHESWLFNVGNFKFGILGDVAQPDLYPTVPRPPHSETQMRHDVKIWAAGMS